MKLRLVFIAVLALLTAPTQAAVDMFLKMDPIKGESRAEGFEKQIDVVAWSFGMSNPVTIGGGGGGPIVGIASFQDISITKYLDSSSPLLMLGNAMGTPHAEWILTFRRSNGSPQGFVFYKVTLNDVIVSSYSISASTGEDIPMEQVSFAYTKITIEYTPTGPDGRPLDPVVFKWDRERNRTF